MQYDPKRPFHERYVRNGAAGRSGAASRACTRDCLALCDALGYDMNTVEFAVRDGIPYAIDFMNPAPDADVNSSATTTSSWIVENAADS